MDAGPTGSIDWDLNAERAIATYSFLQAGCLIECKSVNPLPDIKFMAKPDSFGCVPLTVQFKNLTTGGTMYKWEFPGGTPATSTDVDPIVVYTKAGNYDVTLEAKNPRCSSKLNCFTIHTCQRCSGPQFYLW
jgi:PKD repeat protein